MTYRLTEAEATANKAREQSIRRQAWNKAQQEKRIAQSAARRENAKQRKEAAARRKKARNVNLINQGLRPITRNRGRGITRVSLGNGFLTPVQSVIGLGILGLSVLGGYYVAKKNKWI